MARSWTIFFNASLTGVILCCLALLVTGQAIAQDQDNQQPANEVELVQAVQYEGDATEAPPLFEENDSPTGGQPVTALNDAMNAVRKAYLFQKYEEVLDRCEAIRRTYPPEVVQVKYYETIAQRRLEAIARKDSEKRLYPRISDMAPPMTEETPEPTLTTPAQPATATPSPATQAQTPASASGPSAPALPPAIAPTLTRPEPPSGLPLWMYGLIGVGAVAVILVAVKLVLGRKGKAAEAEDEEIAPAEAEAEADEERPASEGNDDSDMFDPLGGISTPAADDPFASMFDEVAPPESPAPEETPSAAPPENDLSAFENLLDAQAEPESQVNPEQGPIDFSFGEEDEQETVQASAPEAESNAVVNLFDADDSLKDVPTFDEALDTISDEQTAAAEEAEDILTFDGLEQPEPPATLAEEKEVEEEPADFIDEDFSISLDESIHENTAMQETQSALSDQDHEDESVDDGGEDLLLFEEASDNTSVADLRVNETVELETTGAIGNAMNEATQSDETIEEQTQISAPLPQGTGDASPDMFDKERKAGENAFNESDWETAVHHLSIAAALQPTMTEIKAMLREARRNKTEAGVGKG